MFECHLTTEPVFDERLEELKHLCAESPVPFKVAKLYMQHHELSRKDTFMTAHHEQRYVLQTAMCELIHKLKTAGFKIWRYKIEEILVDSKYLGDTLYLVS
jgi:hypothetical protein